MYIDELFSMVQGAPKAKAKYKNRVQFNNILSQLVNMWLNQYKYTDMPETFDERYFELCMLLTGRCGIFNVYGKPISLGIAPSGGVNINGNWLKCHGLAANGDSYFASREFNLYIKGSKETHFMLNNSAGLNVGEPDAVLVRDNTIMYPPIMVLIRFAEQISDIDRTIEVIARTSKSPVLLTGFEQQVSEIKKMVENYSNNEEFILALKNPANSMQAFQVGQDPTKMKDLWEIRENLWNDAMTFMGYKNNPQQDKRERLLTGELNANNEQTDMSGDMGLHCREIGIEWAKDAGFEGFENAKVERNNVENDTSMMMPSEGGLNYITYNTQREDKDDD